MANNRMYLVYRPTGEKVFLAKRMGMGWYSPRDDLSEMLARLFERAEGAWCEDAEAHLDDFCLSMEEPPDSGLVVEEMGGAEKRVDLETPAKRGCNFAAKSTIPGGG